MEPVDWRVERERVNRGRRVLGERGRGEEEEEEEEEGEGGVERVREGEGVVVGVREREGEEGVEVGGVGGV